MFAFHYQIHTLQELVPKCQQTQLTGRVTVNWQLVSNALNRTARVCQTKWEGLVASRLKQGHFTAEEDAIILQRVVEWGDKGQGLWGALEKELERPCKQINKRWRNILSKRKNQVLK